MTVTPVMAGLGIGIALASTPGPVRTLPPTARGVLAILLNPGGWLFVGAVASPLPAAATRAGGTARGLLVAAVAW